LEPPGAASLRRRGSLGSGISPLYLHAVVSIQRKFKQKIAARRARIEVRL